MAIFGMNGVKAVALSGFFLWALYGTKEVCLTDAEIKAIEKVGFRKRKGTTDEKKAIALQFRKMMVERLTGKRYEKLRDDAKFLEAYQKETWLR